jgi:DNA topoisomerase-1
VASAEALVEKGLGASAGEAIAGASVVARGARARWWVRRGTKRRGFHYETSDGKPITDEVQLERIRSLVIPPAWEQVRISPSARSPLQAIGIDKSGRVQRIYHPSFAARQARRKYEKITRFGQELHKLRRKVNEDIALEGLPRERVLAVVIRLMNDLHFRVGSEESVRRYRTYGVTTLRKRHLEIKRGGRLIFSFVGKHHIRHRRILVDEELASLMRDIQKLGGSRLFQYLDAEGKPRPVAARDVNEYIKAATSAEFSAKDFRTWGGTLLSAVELAEIGCPEDERERNRRVVHAVKRVAERLGNTPTVCRSCYIHPSVLESYERGQTIEEFRPRKERRIHRQQPEYEVEEIALLRLLGGERPNV